MIQQFRILAFVSGSVALGCTGAIDRGAEGSGNGDNGGQTGGDNTGGKKPPPPDNKGSLDDAKTVPGARPLRRLTRLEYDNTIRDLLGVSMPSGTKLTDDQGSYDSGFATGGSITGSTDARGVMTIADDIATAALGRLSMLLPCGASPAARADQDSCADKFIESFGLRAFRRPLSSSELDELKTLYRAHRDAAMGETFEQAIGAIITAVLQTPYFLYHWEIGPEGVIKEGGLVRLGPWELASKLSYLFWASMPDEALFTAAKTGKLNSPDDIAREARRLIASDKAKIGLQDFMLQYLEIGNLADLAKAPEFTDYTPALAQAMVQETRDFTNSLFFGAGATGKLEDMLNSTNTTVDAGLAKLYGVSGVSGTGTKAVTLDPAKRAGIFTRASFLAAKAEPDVTHPVKRGVTVLRRAVCVELEVPPNLVVPTLPEPIPGQTTRQRYSMHSMSPCATCHVMIDPVGFAFEHYDPIGAWRDTEENQKVDATGTLSLGNATLKFDGAVQMMKQISSSPEARDCMATQWLRFSLRRHEVNTEDPSLAVLKATMAGSTDIRELMVATVKARTFTHRALSPGEVTQ